MKLKNCNSASPHFLTDYKRVLMGESRRIVSLEYKNPTLFLNTFKRFSASKKGRDARKMAMLQKRLLQEEGKIFRAILNNITEFDASQLSEEFDVSTQKIIMLVMQLDGGDFEERLKERKKVMSSRWHKANKLKTKTDKDTGNKSVADLLSRAWV